MAITKYNLYDSASSAGCDALCLAFLREALIPDWLGENGTVEMDQYDHYELSDGDGNVIASLNNMAGVTSYSGSCQINIDASHSVSFINQNTRFKIGYKTSKGAMIIMDSSYSSSEAYIGTGLLIFGKTNNGKPAMVLKDPGLIDPNTGGYTGRAATTYGSRVGARDDDISSLTHTLTFATPNSGYGVASFDENQTILCPTPTHSNPGETSIIEGVFMMPWAQYRNEGILQINLKRYATNGYWALED
jgi:hypothetical protein